MADLITSSPAPAIVAFIALVLSDHYLTLHGARLYRRGANQIIVLDGSYELNPRFASDVDQLRKISPRFIGLIALYSVVIWGLWLLTVRMLEVPLVFEFAVGAILLVQGPIHVRHVRNVLVFAHATERGGVTGRIEYSRQFSYTASAVELLSFSVLYLIVALLASSWLIAGGALACAVQAFGHFQASRRAGRSAGPIA